MDEVNMSREVAEAEVAEEKEPEAVRESERETSPRKRRRSSPDTALARLTSPTGSNPSAPPSTSRVTSEPPQPIHPLPSSAISSLIHPTGSTSLRRRTLDESDSPMPRPVQAPAPSRYRHSTSPIAALGASLPSQSRDRDIPRYVSPTEPGHTLSPARQQRPQTFPSSTSVPRSSDSFNLFPPPPPPLGRTARPRPSLPPSTADRPSVHPPSVRGPSVPYDEPLYFTQRDSPPLRERERPGPQSFPPSGSGTSSSYAEAHPSTSHQAIKATFSLGPMTPVDMRQWDQGRREAYQRGYTDALKAVQRGVVSVHGSQYPFPTLVRRDGSVPVPVSERPRSIEQPRQSLGESSRSSYPKRHPQPSSNMWLPADRSPQPPHRYPPPHYDYDPYPYRSSASGSSSTWTDDAAEYSQYGHSVPPLSRHPAYPYHTDPGHGPYYPAPHPRAYTYENHPTYASNPTTTTTTTTTGTGGGGGTGSGDGDVSGSPSVRFGPRQLISCYPCRSRKMKCDGNKPCISCIRRGSEAECEFAATVRRRGKGKKNPREGGMSGSESGQESIDERYRMEGMNLPDVGEDRNG